MVSVEKKVDFMRGSRIDVVADILGLSRGGARKTDILYRCGLSLSELEVYLNFLADMGLVREVSESGSSAFETTDKGVAFLQAYSTLKTLLSR